MYILWLLPILLAFVVHQLVRVVVQGKGERRLLPPGPKQLPIIGNLHHLGKLPHQSLWQLSRSHGPVMYLKLGNMPTIVVSSPEMAREVLQTRDLDFCSRPQLVASDKYSYQRSDVSFSPYGEYWRQMRKICIVELFSAKRVQSFRLVRKEEMDLMIKTISSATSRPINLTEILVNLANSIICRVAFGRRYQEEEDKKGGLYQILQESEALLSAFFVADYFPYLGWIDKLTGLASKLDKNARELDAFYEQVIKEHLATKNMSSKHEDIIDVLLEIKNNNTDLTIDSIKAVLMDLFVAGTEAASSTMVWVMSELVRNPRMMKKAQEEIRTLVGADGKVDEDDLHRFHYLKSLIKETLRLHCPVPLLLPHESRRDSKIGGYDIPLNTRVLVNAWGISRDPNNWEDPEEFIPERFSGRSIDFQGHDFKFIPFGSGRRICPGMNFGVVNIEYALANLLYLFDWELPQGMKQEDINMEEAPGLTVHKKSSLVLVPTDYMRI